MRLVLIFTLLLTLLLSCLSQAFAAKSDEHTARLASMTNEYKKYCFDESCIQQLKKMKRYARWQDAKAQLILGTAHLYGDGVKQDINKALKWLTRAANNQTGGKYQQKAQHMLASIYEKGIGIPIDSTKAARLTSLLMSNGYSPVLYKKAQQLIANDDVQGAIELLEQASNNGYRKASYQLASIYLSGDKQTQNLLRASQYLKRIAPYGYRDSREKLADILKAMKNSGNTEDADIEAINQVLAMEVITVNSGGIEQLNPMEMTLASLKRKSAKYRASTGSRIKGKACGQTAYSCSGMSEEDLQDGSDEGNAVETEDNQ